MPKAHHAAGWQGLLERLVQDKNKSEIQVHPRRDAELQMTDEKQVKGSAAADENWPGECMHGAVAAASAMRRLVALWKML